MEEMSTPPPLGFTFKRMKNEIVKQLILRYTEILKAEEYQMTLIPKKGLDKPKILPKYSLQSLLKAAYFLQAKNQEGYHIYCRPVSFEYVMLDDLIFDPAEKEMSLSLFKEVAALKPCMMIRTSQEPGTMRENYQVWFKLGFEPESYDHALEINRYLQQKFGTDPGGIGPRQPARLPGFFNLKSKYCQAGAYPVVQIIKSHDRISPTTHRGRGASFTPKPKRIKNPGDITQSHVDFAIACKMIRQGKSDMEIAARLEQNLPGRRKGAHYIPLTIRKAREAVLKR